MSHNILKILFCPEEKSDFDWRHNFIESTMMILSCNRRIYNTCLIGTYAVAYDANNVKGFRYQYLPIYLVVRSKQDITITSSVRKREREIRWCTRAFLHRARPLLTRQVKTKKKERKVSWKKRRGFISFLEISLANKTNVHLMKKNTSLYIKMGNMYEHIITFSHAFPKKVRLHTCERHYFKDFADVLEYTIKSYSSYYLNYIILQL